MFRSYSALKLLSFCLTKHINRGKLPCLQRNTLLLNNSVLVNSYPIRNYAKGKNKLKEDKGKGKKKHIEVNESFLAEAINFEKLKTEFEHSISNMKEVYASQISLRSSTGSIENLPVTFEGKKFTLIELGHIIRKNPKTIIINMNAFPQAIPSVLKAIQNSGMNLNPQQDGTSLFIPVPKVTREHREALAKKAKVHYVKCRDNIRDTQNKFLKELKRKEKEGLSEDTVHLMSEQIKHFGDQFVEASEKLFRLKETELLGES